MKYGLLRHIGFAKKNSDDARIISMGDVFECVAMLRLYEQMGVNREDIIECDQYDLNVYQGEYIVLPINLYHVVIQYSPRILPAFVGVTLGGAERELQPQEEHIFRQFQPVGCRDERTMRRLRAIGIDAYFSGCMVATFPKREPNPERQTKVYFVDPQAGIKDYIPEELLRDYEFFSHDFYMTPEEMADDGDLYKLGEDTIRKYAETAKLIVTSKFHAAIIALAMGIPVILTMENNYYKYSWITKYIPLYEPKDFANIDWNPPAITISDDEKKLMTDVAIGQIKRVHDQYYDKCRLSELREDLEIKEFVDIFYGSYAIEYIKKNWEPSLAVEYSVWGVTFTAERLIDYISENYPKAKLVKVFDFSVRAPFRGIIPEPYDNIHLYPHLFVFVTGNSASERAIDLFQETNKPEAEFFLCRRQILTSDDLA